MATDLPLKPSSEFLPPELIKANENMEGTVVNVHQDFIQVMVPKFHTPLRFPNTEVAVLKYFVDDHLKRKFPKKENLLVGTKVIVSGDPRRLNFCRPGSLRLPGDPAPSSKKASSNSRQKSNRNEAKPGQNSNMGSQGKERILRNVNAEVMAVEPCLELRCDADKERIYVATRPHRHAPIFNAPNVTDGETIYMNKLKGLVQVGDTIKVDIRFFVGDRVRFWTVEKIMLKKAEREDDLIQLNEEPAPEANGDNAETLRKETSNLLLDMNANQMKKALKADPNIAAVNYARSPLPTLAESHNEMDQIVDLQADILADAQVQELEGNYEQAAEEMVNAIIQDQDDKAEDPAPEVIEIHAINTENLEDLEPVKEQGLVPEAQEIIEKTNDVKDMVKVNDQELDVQAPESNVQAPVLNAQAPEFNIQAPEAIVQAPEAIVQAPEAVVQAPEANVQAPEASESNVQVQELDDQAAESKVMSCTGPVIPDAVECASCQKYEFKMTREELQTYLAEVVHFAYAELAQTDLEYCQELAKRAMGLEQ